MTQYNIHGDDADLAVAKGEDHVALGVSKGLITTRFRLGVDKARRYAWFILRLCDELDPPAKVEHIED